MKSKLETIEAVREFNIALETAANRLKAFKIDEDCFEDTVDRKNDGENEGGKAKFYDKDLPARVSLSVVATLPYAVWSEDLIKAADKLVNILYPGIDKRVS